MEYGRNSRLTATSAPHMHHVCLGLDRELLSVKLRDTRDCKAEDRGPAHCDAIQGPILAKKYAAAILGVYKNDNFCKKRYLGHYYLYWTKPLCNTKFLILGFFKLKLMLMAFN